MSIIELRINTACLRYEIYKLQAANHIDIYTRIRSTFNGWMAVVGRINRKSSLDTWLTFGFKKQKVNATKLINNKQTQ